MAGAQPEGSHGAQKRRPPHAQTSQPTSRRWCRSHWSQDLVPVLVVNASDKLPAGPTTNNMLKLEVMASALSLTEKLLAMIARCNLHAPVCGLLFEDLQTRGIGGRCARQKDLIFPIITRLDVVYHFPCSSSTIKLTSPFLWMTCRRTTVILAPHPAKAVLCRLRRLEHRRCRSGCTTSTSFCKGAKAATCPGTRILGPSKQEMVLELQGCALGQVCNRCRHQKLG